MDAREKIMIACKALNESKILLHEVSVKGIEFATGKDLQSIVNKFLDDVETVPESQEHNLPKIVLETYNGVVEQRLLFKSPDIPQEIINIKFVRTRFPHGRISEAAKKD